MESHGVTTRKRSIDAPTQAATTTTEASTHPATHPRQPMASDLRGEHVPVGGATGRGDSAEQRYRNLRTQRHRFLRTAEELQRSISLLADHVCASEGHAFLFLLHGLRHLLRWPRPSRRGRRLLRLPRSPTALRPQRRTSSTLLRRRWH